MVIFLSVSVAYMMTDYEIGKRDELWQAEEKKESLRGMVSKIQESEYGWNIYVEQVILGEKRYNQFLVQCEEEPGVKLGNEILVTGSLSQFELARNYGNFDSKKYYMSIGIYAKINAEDIQVCDTSYDNVRENLYQLRCKINGQLKKICDISGSYSNVISQIFSVCKGKDSIFSAILLGEKAEMDTEIKDLYSASGIAHILAISGLHISFIGMFVYRLLRKRFKFAVSSAISIIFVVAFGIMSGMGIATIRAVVMFGLRLLGEVLGRVYDYLTAISTAGIMLMMWNPFVIFNSGFQMSFAAIIAITLVWQMVCNILRFETKAKEENLPNINRRERLKNKAKVIVSNIKCSLIFGLNIGLIMNPIIAFNYFQLPTYSFLLNLIVVPLMSVVIVSGMVGISLSFVNVWFGRLGLLSGCVILEMYTLLCKIVNKLPLSNVIAGKPSVFAIVAYYLILAGFIFVANYIRNKKDKEEKEKERNISKEGRKIESKIIRIAMQRIINRKFRMASLIIYVILGLIIYNPTREFFREKNLEVTFLDVGQGDGIFIRTENGTTITVDGGSTSVDSVGKYRIIPFMKSQAIKKIDYAIVTHADADHISGLSEMILESDNNGVRIKNLVMPEIRLKDDTYLSLISSARNHKVNVLYITKGNTLRFGDVEAKCLYPQASTKAEDRNDYSTVLNITYDKFSMLLTGDISTAPESEIMDLLQDNYTILKVAHHGSKYSTSEEFLERTKPDYSVISVGEHNLYGHPSYETLERLKQSGSRILRTDECGGIMVKTDGKTIEIDKTKK